MGEEPLSTLSIPSPPLPPPKNAVKIFRPTDNILAQGDVGAMACKQRLYKTVKNIKTIFFKIQMFRRSYYNIAV